jgi:hypothetical protein
VLSDEELRELVERELREDIEHRIRDGATRDQIVASLVEEGFVAETARAYVRSLAGACEPPRSRRWLLLSAIAACLVVTIAVVVLALLT